LVEDVEYGIELSLSGHRVAFAEEAQILGEMVSTGEAAVSQRKRWEEGRWHLTRKYSPPLLYKALRHQSLLLFDLAMDLLVPPLSYVGIIGFMGLCLEGIYYVTTGQLSPSIYLWIGSLSCLALYVIRGVQHSRLGLQGVLVLCYAPAYVVWKLLIARPFGSRGKGKWIRTQREDNSK
jgi:cellulose synthase/poly-beta-1,6-N-acetylglucosamine synthase-like glycosyltransferase